MSTFVYRGYDQSGASRKGMVEAESLKEARSQLASEGVLVESLSQPVARRLALEPRAAIYRELGALLCSGMTLPQSLSVMCGAGEDKRRGGTLARLRDSIMEGSSFSNALAELQIGVSDFELSALESAERSGAIGEVFDDLATLLEQQCQVRERIVSALIYPALVFVMGIVVASLMLGILVPRSAEMLKGTQVALPPLTSAMIWLGRMSPMMLSMFAAAGAIVWLLVMRLQSRDKRRLWIDRLLLAIPFVGAARLRLCAMRLCRTLALLIRGGVPLVDALPLAGDASGSACTSAQMRKNVDVVRDGGAVSDALSALKPMGPLLADWARVGESGGNLEVMLLTAADRFSLQWDRRISRIMALLEPFLILLIGAFVLLVCLSVLLPVLSLSQSVG